jgi:PAS domain S-box-containing protein
VPSPLFSRRWAARSLGFLFISGSVVGVITLLLPHDSIVKEGPIYGLAALATTIGMVTLARADAMQQWELHAILAVGTCIVGAANYFVGTGSLYPIMYSWTALYAFTFFPFRAALGHMALIGISYAVVLAVLEESSPVVRWVLTLGTPFVAGVLISRLLDVVGRRTRVLTESETRIRAIVESAPDAFITIDSDGRVVSWNRQAERLFGISYAQARGRDVGELMFAPEHRAAHVERRDRDLEGPPAAAPVRREVEMVRHDGQPFPAEITVSRIQAEGRVLLGFFVRDISARREQEVERAALYREQAARAEAEQMAGIVHGLQVLLDAALSNARLDDMLAALIPRLCEVLSADAATILLTTDEGDLQAHASTAPGGEDERADRIALGEGIAGRVAQSGKHALVNDPDPAQVRDRALSEMSSILSVPLFAGDVVTGVIQVGRPSPRRFVDEDVVLLGLAADRVALAIDHARVFEREHKIAETLQRSLLPDRLPPLPGLEVAARYLPAASEAEVGGDWYDVIPFDSGRVGLVMGDVAGKGLAAASMVGRLRSALRAYALEGHKPHTVVRRLNELVWSEVGDNEMVTLVFAVVDPQAGQVTWVNAGHPPPLVVGPDGGASYLDGPTSLPLGVMPFPVYEEAAAGLDPGQTLLMFTDGLVERPGELLDDGLTRLTGAVAGAGARPQRLCDGVLARLVPPGGAPDDVALLALHSPPLTNRLHLELPPEPDRLAPMRALLHRWLRHVEASDVDIAEITSATGEAAANAIEHGGATGKAPFAVDGSAEEGEVTISVSDTGTWRPEREDGRGRGLVLMRAMMDVVEVVPGSGGTVVRMRRRLRGGAGGA